jgi:hypothetical protein
VLGLVCRLKQKGEIKILTTKKFYMVQEHEHLFEKVNKVVYIAETTKQNASVIECEINT